MGRKHVLIWGWQRQVLTLAVLAAFCGACRNTGPHGLRKLVTKFTLFFVPLFPISRTYLECPVCGVQSPVPAADVPNLVAQADQPPGPLIHTVPPGVQQPVPPQHGRPQPAPAQQNWQQPVPAQQNWQQPAPQQGPQSAPPPQQGW
ncbi:hypothetical protein [Nocardia sp. NPDC057227]|uniref:hypothetical protein n=1 Tax=Nocardia sp. NPDC057227 TaxID=3346056 RepID=UPI00362D0FAC